MGSFQAGDRVRGSLEGNVLQTMNLGSGRTLVSILTDTGHVTVFDTTPGREPGKLEKIEETL